MNTKNFKRRSAAILAAIVTFGTLSGQICYAASASKSSENFMLGAGQMINSSSTLTVDGGNKANADFTVLSSNEDLGTGRDGFKAAISKKNNDLSDGNYINFNNAMIDVINNGIPTYYATNGKMYIETGAGRGVSVVKLPAGVTINNITSLLTSASQGNATEIGEDIINSGNSLDKLLQFYQSSPSDTEKYLSVKTELKSEFGDGTTKTANRTLYGYLEDFEGKNLPSPIVTGVTTVSLAAKNNYLNNGTYDTPYTNLFETDDEGVVEDAYILIRKALGMDNVASEDNLPEVNKISSVITCDTSFALTNWLNEGKRIIEEYENAREAYVNQEVSENLKTIQYYNSVKPIRTSRSDTYGGIGPWWKRYRTTNGGTVWRFQARTYQSAITKWNEDLTNALIETGAYNGKLSDLKDMTDFEFTEGMEIPEYKDKDSYPSKYAYAREYMGDLYDLYFKGNMPEEETDAEEGAESDTDENEATEESYYAGYYAYTSAHSQWEHQNSQMSAPVSALKEGGYKYVQTYEEQKAEIEAQYEKYQSIAAENGLVEGVDYDISMEEKENPYTGEKTINFSVIGYPTGEPGENNGNCCGVAGNQYGTWNLYHIPTYEQTASSNSEVQEDARVIWEEELAAAQEAYDEWSVENPEPQIEDFVAPEALARMKDIFGTEYYNDVNNKQVTDPNSIFGKATQQWQEDYAKSQSFYYNGGDASSVSGIISAYTKLTTAETGAFQSTRRTRYDLAHPEEYQQYLNAINTLDVGGYNITYSGGNGQNTSLSEKGLEDPDIELMTMDETDALVWYLYITEGYTEIPKDLKVKTIEGWVGSADEAARIKAFREWLIQHDLYLYEGGPNFGYTLNQDIYDGGKLLDLWDEVYGEAVAEGIYACAGKSNDVKAIVERGNVIDKTYSYLEGYTIGAYVQMVNGKNARLTDSVFNKTMNFYNALGVINGNNIPEDKHIELYYYTDISVVDYTNDNSYQDANFQRYEWYVYYNPNMSGSSKTDTATQVVYHATTTTETCPFTPAAKGRYWVECYQSGKRSYGEHLNYTQTNFLVEEQTKTVLMAIQSRDNIVKIDEKLLAEKTLLMSDEQGYVLESDASTKWRAEGDRVVQTFNTERVSDN